MPGPADREPAADRLDRQISTEIFRRQQAFEQPVGHPFFSESYQPGETSNAALLRMFRQLQWSVSLTDEQAIESLARYR